MNINLINTGDLLVVGHSESFVSKSISKLTNSEYSHTAIFWWNYDELFVIESDGSKFFSRPGVILTPFKEYLESGRKLLVKKPLFSIDGSEWGKFMLTKVGKIHYSYFDLIVAQPIYILSNKKLWVGTTEKNVHRMVCSAWTGYIVNHFNPDRCIDWVELQPKDWSLDEINYKYFCEIIN